MHIQHGFILHAQAKELGSGVCLSYFVRTQEKLVRLDFPNQKIPFFINRESQFTPHHFQYERKSAELKNFQHGPVDIIYLSKLSDISLAKQYCEQNGIKSHEIDIPLTERFLMERFIFGQIEFKGEEQIIHDQFSIISQAEIRPGKYRTPAFKIMSLDIETGVKGELYSIAYHQRESHKEIKKVFMLTDSPQVDNELIEYHHNERELLQAFLESFQLVDPDIIVGWHVIGFDLMFLEKKCQELQIPFILGRDNKKIQLEERKSVGFFATIPGRIVLDGPPTLRSAFYQYKNFKLETVAQAVLGASKDIADQGKVEEIERRFQEDKQALAKYNLLDCTLVLDIFEKLNIIDQLTKRVTISGLLLDRLAVSTAAFDFVFLPKLHRKGYVAPNRIDFERDDLSPGGMVIEPQGGLHENIAVLDFKSLYPSIMLTFSIDPYSLIQSEHETIKTPQGYQFSNTEHILPEIIQNLLNNREQAKQNQDPYLSQAVKILMNSFYGILGSTRCRFYHSDLASAITTTGHYILKESINFLNQLGHDVIYGDTDSLFVKVGPEMSQQKIQQLAKKVDHYLSEHLAEKFKVKSYLICEFEKLFDQIYFSKSRSGQGIAKKRYAGMSSHELEFKGMEFVRSDWTELAKTFQHQLFQRFFKKEDLEEFIKSFIKDLEMGLYDDQLVYTKRLSKDPKEYTKNIPPHVKAALKVNHTGPYRLKEISYLMTKEGPEPVGKSSYKLDYNHYIERQLQPIADDVLTHFNKSFDSFIVGDQLTLF